jgi:hypothetical protein
MKLKVFSIAALSSLITVSCIKHEVIPPPKPKVDLSSSFTADTSGFPLVYTKDVDGYFVEATNFRELQASPQLSNIVYYNTIRSTNYADLFRVSVGRAYWDAANGQFPSVSQFKLFFEGLSNPNFSDDGINGIMLEWRDSSNKLWRTREASTQPQNFVFTSILQESDEIGDYVKFTSEFSAYLYSLDGLDSIRFENGRYSSFFKNN